MQNRISIISDELHIEEKEKITSHWLRFLFVVLGIQAGVYWYKFFENQQNYDLFIAIFITILVTIFIAREIFFRTYRNVIKLKEIRNVSIEKITFEKEKVYLNIKLKIKSRVILTNKNQAVEIKNDIESAKKSTVGNNI
ncbi:hypothetical protein [Salinimicrobium sediminilitoris]|uniref:hypothetical protein n=1 Tax=Salinimicrobium sediminilitoris TaxID=2876715 RepID=UPI001E37D28D|nr:hypothetical protein [Salinimicrobium sediminilitoris]MCC8358902.1 hypothetical protein [Salinimicrobium sediminilitoris]